MKKNIHGGVLLLVKFEGLSVLESYLQLNVKIVNSKKKIELPSLFLNIIPLINAYHQVREHYPM